MNAAGTMLDVAWVDASHLRACLPMLGGKAVQQLQACTRLQRRLGDLVARHYLVPPLPEGVPDTPQERLALASPETIRAAGRLMGAAWHGASVRLVVGRPQVVALIDAIGAPARLFALRNSALAVAPGQEMAPETLAGAVRDAADACLGAWLALLPDGIRERGRLKLPASLAMCPGPEGCMGLIAARAAEAVLSDG